MGQPLVEDVSGLGELENQQGLLWPVLLQRGSQPCGDRAGIVTGVRALGPLLGLGQQKGLPSPPLGTLTAGSCPPSPFLDHQSFARDCSRLCFFNHHPPRVEQGQLPTTPSHVLPPGTPTLGRRGTLTGGWEAKALLQQAVAVRELGRKVLQAAGDGVQLLWRPYQLAG